MEHNSLTGIACARPIIYAEGLFAPCTLEDGKFIPEEGLSQQDLCSILNGELFKSGSDLVDDFALKMKLEKLAKKDETNFELDYFPKDNIKLPNYTSNITDSITKSTEKEREEILKDGIPLVRIRQNSSGNAPGGSTSSVDILRTPSFDSEELRDFFEKQITWLLEEEEGEDFVVMETCSRFRDALVLLDILKQHNLPCVLSFLARRDEPVAISFSKIQIGLDSLMFCLFQA
ncbi:uncharacterized protein [Clytia hemisphaerica]|uniref:Hcy-binding domain-containing protein n=1 Tax=Clytia hemisphaerica TaxID=252671 RepID=A0A7M5U5W7_9CNID